MSNIVPVQGGAYSNSYAEQPSSAASSNEGAGFSNMMGQVAGSGLALTPNVAQSLMYRSMTTGVPTAELEQYGGYSAVKAMFDAGGGSYSLDAIPVSQRQALTQQVASSGVGNMALLLNNAGSAGKGFTTLAGTETPLTPALATNLMQRSMTTGVPKAEMDLYGGYDAVKAMFDAQGGSYSTQDIPTAQKQQLAMQVAATGVGNFALPASEHISVSPAVLQTMAANGIDVGTINTIQQNTAAPFVDSTSYIDSLMDSLGSNATAKKS